MKKEYLKRETEGLIMAAQDQSLRARWVKYYIDRSTDSLKYRMCRKLDKNVSHIVSKCNKLAQDEYKKLRKDKVAVLLRWQWCKTCGFKMNQKYYEHLVEKEMKVLENDKTIQTEAKIGHNKSDLILSDNNGIRIQNHLVCKRTLSHIAKLAKCWVLICTVHLTVCYYQVTHGFIVT